MDIDGILELDEIPPAPKLERETTVSSRKVCSTCPTIIPDTAADYISQCVDCYKDPTTKRVCEQCKQPKITVTEPEWKKICGNCFKHGKKRACVHCNLNNILDSEPAWRTLCSGCFKNPLYYRKCSVCNLNTIKPGTPPYLNKCGQCWLSKREKTHTQCPVCKDDRLKMRIGHNMCRDCMKKQGFIKTNFNGENTV